MAKRKGSVLRGWLPLATNPAAPPPADVGGDAFPVRNFADLERLQRQGPVHAAPAPGRARWLVVSHQAVDAVLAEPAVFSSRSQMRIDPALLGADPTQHAKVRRFLATYFSGEAQATLLTGLEEQAESLLRPRFDAVRDFAVPLTDWVGSRLVGIQENDFSKVKQGAQARHAGLAPPPGVDLDAEVRRATLFHRIVAEAEGLLDATEAASLVSLLATASTETVERLIVRSLLILAQREDVGRELVERPGRLPVFIEEVLRLFPPEPVIDRETTRATVLAGIEVPAGAQVRLSIAAANRDPTEFPDPHALRLDRARNRHFAFGGGSHQCIGAGIGRRIAAVALSVILREAPDFRPAEPLESLDFEVVGERLLPRRLLVQT